MTIKKYDSKGIYLTFFGKGKGQAPEEFSNIMNIYVNNENDVYVIDQSRVTRFDASGRLLNIYNSETSFQNAIMLSDSILVDYYLPDDQSFRYYKLNNEGIKLSHKSRQLIENQTSGFLSISGASLWRSNPESFVYVSLFGGVICKYRNVEKIYCRSTIDSQSLPELKYTDGIYTFKNEEEVAGGQRIISIKDRTLYIIKVVNNQGNAECYIDLYNEENGNYQSSIEYDSCLKRGRIMYMDEERLIIQNNGHFILWSKKNK